MEGDLAFRKLERKMIYRGFDIIATKRGYRIRDGRTQICKPETLESERLAMNYVDELLQPKNP